MRWFIRNESGAAAVFVALLAPVLIGFAALGTEVGLWMLTQRKLQHLADVSAYTAATRSLSTTSLTKDQHDTEIRRAVLARGAASGLTDRSGNNKPFLENVSVPYNTHRASVTLTRTIPRYLTRLFTNSETLKITVDAVADVEERGGVPACIVALSGDGNNILLDGSGSLILWDITNAGETRCAIISNSEDAASISRKTNGSTLEVECLYTAGNTAIRADGTKVRMDCDAPQTLQPQLADPFQDTPLLRSSDVNSVTVIAPTISGRGSNKQITYTATQTVPTSFGTAFNGTGLKVARINSDVDFKSNVVFEPGLYILDGITMSIDGGTISGDNVTFYLVNGSKLQSRGGPDINLNAYVGASRKDPYSGILFMSGLKDAPAEPVVHEFIGNMSLNSTGVVYLPEDKMLFTGSTSAASTSEMCLRFLVAQIEMDGNGSIDMSCDFSKVVPSNLPFIGTLPRVALKN